MQATAPCLHLHARLMLEFPSSFLAKVLLMILLPIVVWNLRRFLWPKAVSVVFHRLRPVKSLFTSARDSIDLATHVISIPFFSYELITSPIC